MIRVEDGDSEVSADSYSFGFASFRFERVLALSMHWKSVFSHGGWHSFTEVPFRLHYVYMDVVQAYKH